MLTYSRGVIPTLEETKQQVRSLRLVEATERVSDQDVALLKHKGLEAAGVSTGADWYAWLRNQQGDLDAMLHTGIITDDAAFLDDGLFCEWAYLVDLDTLQLRVYSGGRNEVASFDLDSLPTDEAFLTWLSQG